MKKLAIASAIVVLALPALSSTAAPPAQAVAGHWASESRSGVQRYSCQWLLINGAWYCIPY